MSEEAKNLEVSAAEIEFIRKRGLELVSQGMNEIEAGQIAGSEWKQLQEQADNQGEALWDKVTKDVGLAEFLDDQIRRGLGAYKSAWDKKNAPQTIDFKLQLKPRGGVGHGRMIAGVDLFLEVSRNGVWKVFRHKKIDFVHIREMRDGHKWKLALYESLYRDLMSWGVTYCLLLDANKNGIPINAEDLASPL